MIGLIAPSFSNSVYAEPGDGYTGSDGVEKGKENKDKKDKSEKDAKDAKDDPIQKSGDDDKTKDENGNKKEDKKSDAQKEKEQEDRAKALNPGKNAPGGDKKEAERKEKNPTKEEKEAKERVDKQTEEAKEKEKEKEKEVEDNKGTEDDSRKNSPDKNKNNEFSEDAKKKGNDPETGESKGKGKIKGKDSQWTLYAQMIMGKAIDTKKQDDKSKGVLQRGFDGVVSGIIGDGGVQLDIPYSKFSALNKQLVEGKDVDKYKGGEQGRNVASFLATYSKYGYINTISGNKIASEGSELVGGFVRVIAGIIALIGLVLYTLINKVTEWFSKALVMFNPYHALGFDKGDTVLPKNPVSTKMKEFFNAMGINGEFFQTLLELGILIISFIFLMAIIKNIFDRNIRALTDNVKKWIVRVVVIVVGLPVLALTASGISKTVSNFADLTNYNDSPAVKHLVDTRAMASGTNLSPDGLDEGKIPEAGATQDYIDKDFEPSENRNMIARINKESYERFYKDENESSIGFKILSKWMMNNNFNVNTYIADLRTDANLPGVANFDEAYANAKDLSKAQKEKLSRRDLEYVMWSGTQNADEDLRKPDFKNFDPTMPLGVYENKTFSTQSVVLMLQSSFDASSAKFYAYNFAPKNNQANLKNLTTVKTEWKEISMPGDGIVGGIGSWLSLISQSLSYVLLASAVLMALFTTTMVTGFIFFIKQAINTIILGSVPSLFATFLIYLGGVFSVIVAITIPGVFLKLVDGSGFVFGEVTNNFIPPGFIDITTSLISLAIAYWLSYGGRVSGTNETPVKLVSTFFMKIALDFEQRVGEMNRRNSTSIKESLKGASYSASGRAKSTSRQLGSRMSQDARSGSQGMKGMSKGAMSGLAKGAAVGLATGGTGAVVAGASKGLAKGAGKGALAGVNTPDGGKKGLQNALDAQGLGKGGFGEIKQAISKGKQGKVANSAGRANSKGALNGQQRREAYDQYSHARNNNMLSKVNHDAKSPNGKYGALYDSKGRLSQQSNANPNELDKIEGTNHLYDNDSKDALAGYSEKASDYASQATYMDDSGDEQFERKRFTQEEVDNLATAKDENDFVDKLGDTTNGMGYALDSDNARSILEDTKFVDSSGEVDNQAVEKFQKETDSKFKTGELTDNDLKDKAKLDDAFVMGAKEKYRIPNAKYQNNFAHDAQDSHRQQLHTEASKGSGNKQPSTQSADSTGAMVGSSDKTNRSSEIRRSNTGSNNAQSMSYKDRVNSRNNRQATRKQPKTNDADMRDTQRKAREQQKDATEKRQRQAKERESRNREQQKRSSRERQERREKRAKDVRSNQKQNQSQAQQRQKNQSQAQQRQQEVKQKQNQSQQRRNVQEKQKEQQSKAQQRQKTQRQAQQRQQEVKQKQNQSQQRPKQQNSANETKRPSVNRVDNQGHEYRSKE